MRKATYALCVVLALLGCRSHPSDEPLWQITLKSRIYADPIVDGERFYVFSQAGEAIAASLRDGKKIWEVQTSGPILGTPALAPTEIFAVTQNGDLYSIHKETGKVQWRKHFNDTFIAPVTLTQGSILLPSESGTLYAADVKTGAEVWRLSGETKFNARAVVSNNSIYIGSWKRQLLSIKPTGAINWKFETPEIVAEEPIVWKNFVYLPAYDRYVYAIDAQTGRQIWRHPASKPSNVVLLNGEAVFASDTDLLYVGAQSGKLKRKLKFGKIVTRLYADNAKLYALSNEAYRINYSDSKSSRLFKATHPIFKLTFGPGMIIAVDSLYSIYGYAREEEP